MLVESPPRRELSVRIRKNVLGHPMKGRTYNGPSMMVENCIKTQKNSRLHRFLDQRGRCARYFVSPPALTKY